MPRWSAAQLLSRFALEKPLERTQWPSDMSGRILPAQLKLHEAIVQRRITDVQGRLGLPGSKEQRLTELFNDAESMGFTLLVTPYGTLTVHPPYKRHKFEEKHKIDLDDWWRGINFDQDEGEEAFSASLTPCQRQPARLHLRLVLGARSGETAAVGNEAGAVATAIKTAESPPKKQLGTTGRPPEKRDAATEKMRADLRKQRLTPDELRNMKQVALAGEYDCGRETACKARARVLSE